MGIASTVFQLLKYKLSLAVTLSAATGFFLYPVRDRSGFLILAGGVFCLAGGAAALNQFQEHRRDALMARTSLRPIPSGRISPRNALIVAIIFSIAGALILSLAGWKPVLLGILTLALYNGLYTRLKSVTSFAVIPGGLVGAIPPLIGWTAAGGPLLHPVILFVATLMFLWQMPHFWLLTIRYGEEYEAAGFRTLKRRLDNNQIKRLVFWWMAISLVFLLTASLFGIDLEAWLFISLAVLNAIFIGFFYVILFRSKSEKMMKVIFIGTNVLLTLILLALILNSLPG